MFTGIIREVGTVQRIERNAGGATIAIAAPRSRPRLTLGGSIAVDGVCLTVTALEESGFAADAIPETLARTRLGELRSGAAVNLELSLCVGDALDGHWVQGHVDGLGTVQRVRDAGNQRELTIRTTRELARFIAEKGSIALNGVSLTVTHVTDETFAVALIPTTMRETNLQDLSGGSRVNIEIDVVARTLARLMSTSAKGTLTADRLGELGY